jgi:hypothetical protein
MCTPKGKSGKEMLNDAFAAPSEESKCTRELTSRRGNERVGVQGPEVSLLIVSATEPLGAEITAIWLLVCVLHHMAIDVGLLN